MDKKIIFEISHRKQLLAYYKKFVNSQYCCLFFWEVPLPFWFLIFLKEGISKNKIKKHVDFIVIFNCV